MLERLSSTVEPLQLRWAVVGCLGAWLLAGSAGCGARSSAAWDLEAPRAEGPGWLKGQLHLHSNVSPDSDTPPPLAVTEALGGVAMLDHPNFHYSADATLVTALAGRGLRLLEVANEATTSNNGGDARHPSTEALWDAVLSNGARVWGVATDDAHHYYDAEAVRARGQPVLVGDRGWVMVRAEPEPATIRAALERGEFYASNGVQLDDVIVDGRTLWISVDAATTGTHRFTFIGNGGKRLRRHRGRRARFTVPEGYTGYVRAVVQDRLGRKAWVQPVWFRAGS